jgi:hypothetical protein
MLVGIMGYFDPVHSVPPSVFRNVNNRNYCCSCRAVPETTQHFAGHFPRPTAADCVVQESYVTEYVQNNKFQVSNRDVCACLLAAVVTGGTVWSCVPFEASEVKKMVTLSKWRHIL